MSILLRAACLLALSFFAWGASAIESRADVVCTVSQPDISYYLDAEEDACRTGGSYPENGAMVRADIGSDYVMIDVSYAAGFGVREPTDLHCTSGPCGVGELEDGGGEIGDVGDVMACEGDCKGGFSYVDAWGNRKNVALDFRQSLGRITATLTGNHGPQGIGVMTVDVPASLPIQNGVFTLEYDFSELAERVGGGAALPLVIEGGVLDRTTVFGTVWTARIVPTGEEGVSITLPEGSMEGALTGNALDADYTTFVPVDMTPPEVVLSYVGAGPDGQLSEIFKFETDDRTAVPSETPSVSVSGVDAVVEFSQEDDNIFTVTAAAPGIASITLDAGAFVDQAGNASPASASLEHEFGERVIDVVELTAVPGWVASIDDGVTFTARIEPSIDTGRINFYINGSRVHFDQPSNGEVSFTPLYLEVGDHEVRAVYDPRSASYVAGAEQSATVTIERGTLDLFLATSVVEAQMGTDITLTGAVSSAYTGDLSLEASRDGGLFSVTSDFAIQTDDGFEITTRPEQAGNWRYRVIASETEGHSAATSNIVSVDVVDFGAGGELSVVGQDLAVGDRPILRAVMSDADMAGEVVFYQDGVEIGRVTLSGGTAELTAPEIELVGTISYSAEYAADAPWLDADLGSVEVIVPLESVSASLSADSGVYSVGQHALLTLSLGEASATGSVDFEMNGSVFATAPVEAGVARAQSPTFEDGGTATFTASYSGDAVFAPSASNEIEVSIDALATQLSLAATPASVAIGEPVDLMADISPQGAGGEVVFFADGVQIGTVALQSGVSTLTFTPQSAGEIFFHAEYAGDGQHSANRSVDVAVSVARAQANGSFSTDKQAYVLDETVEMTAVFAQDDISGTVEFLASGQVLATAPVRSGAASAAFEPARAGDLRLEARYGGDQRYASMMFPAVDIVIAPRDTSGSVSLGRTDYTVGQTATARASVSPISATGRVEFFVDGASVGYGTLSGGSAERLLSPWQEAGDHFVSARYEGDANHRAADLESTVASVARTSAFVSLGTDYLVYDVDARPVLTADITPPPAGGQVIFYQDGAEIGRVSASGLTASFEAPQLAEAGAVNFSAAFTGDAGIEAGASSPVSITVRPLEVSVELTIDGVTAGAMAKVDDMVGVRAVLSRDVNRGTVRLLQDGAEIATLPASGRIYDFEADTTQAGTHRLEVRFEDGTRYAAASSPVRLLEVSRHPTAVSLRSTNAAPNAGEIITLIAEVSPDAAGMVTFRDGGSALATAAVLGGEARTSLTVEERGYSLSAQFMPQDDRVFESSESETLGFQSGKIPATIVLDGTSVEVSPAEEFSITGAISDESFEGSVILMRRPEGGVFTEVDAQAVSLGMFSFLVSEVDRGRVDYRVEMAPNPTHAAPVSELFVASIVALPGDGLLLAEPEQPMVGTTFNARFVPDDGEATGTVEFFYDGFSAGTAEISGGAAVLAIPASAAGPHTLGARYLGSTTHASFTAQEVDLTVGLRVAGLTITADKETYDLGEIATFTITADVDDAEGMVELRRNGEMIASGLMEAGTAVIGRVMQTAGQFAFDGRFLGSEIYAEAVTRAPVSIEIVRGEASGTLAVDSADVEVGDVVEVTASVEPQEAGGVVRFFARDVFFDEAPLENGLAVASFTPTSAGPVEFHAVYQGSAEFEAFEIAQRVSLEVHRISTSATLTADRLEYQVGESAILTLTFDRVGVSGMAEFFQDGDSIGMAPLSSGRVSLSALIDTAGQTAFTATYGGDERHAPFETAEPLVITGVAEVSSVSLSPLPATVRGGEEVVFSGEVDIAAFNSSFDDRVALEMRPEGGAWTEVGQATAVGSGWEMTYRPVEEGPTSFRAAMIDAAQPDGRSYSQIREILVERADTVLTLTTDASRVGLGETVKFDVEATPLDIEGEVRIEIDGEPVATRAFVAGGASFETSFAKEGRYEIVAFYDGTPAFRAAASTPVAIDAGRIHTTLSLETATRTHVVGDEAVFVARLDPALDDVTLHLDQDGIEIDTVRSNNGVATFRAPLTEAGDVSFQARFVGTAAYADASSPEISISVIRAPVEGRLLADAESYALGDTAELRLEIDQPEATGRVIFMSDSAVLAQADLVNGEASVEVSLAQEGLMAITAHYEGDDAFETWSTEMPVYIAVARDLRELSLAASNETPGLGDVVTFSGRLSGASVSGSVRLLEMIGQEWQEVDSTDLQDGAFSVNIEITEEGTRRFRAEMANHPMIATAPSTEVEIRAFRETLDARLESDALVYEPSADVLLIFSVDRQDLSGEVSFMIDGGEVFAVAPLVGGEATARFMPTQSGNFEIIARFDGNADTAPAEARVTVSVGVTATSGAMSSDKETYEPGDLAEIVVEISPDAATGDVVLVEDGAEIARAALRDGEVRFEILLDEAGRREIHSRYLGDEDHAAWGSPDPLVLETGLEEVRITLETLTAEARAGEPAQFRLTVLPDPSEGEVLLRLTTDDPEVVPAPVSSRPAATESRAIALDGSEVYEFEVIMPMSGALSVEASYAGNGSFASAEATTSVEVAAPAETALVLTLSNIDPGARDDVVLTATVEPGTITGEIAFLVDGAVVATAPLAGGSSSAIWEAISGDHVLQARYAGDPEHAAAESNKVSISVRSRALDLFDERREFIEGVMDKEMDRAADARARMTERHMSGVRDRLRDEDYRQLPRDPAARELSHGSWEGAVWEPFQFSGQARGTDGAFDADGTFSARRRIGGTDLSQFVNGAFEVTSRSDYGTSFEGNVSTAVEKRLSEDAIVGASVGVEGAETAIVGEMDGTMRTMGVNAGVYGAKRLAGDVVVDGFANVARLNHRLDLADEELVTDSTYNSTAVQVGGTVSGRYEMGRTEFLPAVTLRHTMAVRDRATFSARADGEEAQAVVEGRTTHTTRVEVTPEVRMKLREEGGVVTTLKPKVICEAGAGGTECGAGVGAGVEVPVAEGRGKIKAEASVESVGGETRKTLFLGFEIVF